MFSWYFHSNLLLRITAGLIIGAVVGIAMGFAPAMIPGYVKYTKFFGDVFINLLRMIVVPTIFFSLIVGASSITPAQLGKVGGKTLIYYLVTSAICIGIALVLANIFAPGTGLNMVGDSAAAAKELKAPGFAEVLLAIIPTNPVNSLAKGDVLPIIFFALIFGIALAILRDMKGTDLGAYADTTFHVFSALAEVMYKIVHGVMQYAPIGVFVLISIVFAQQGPKVIGPTLYVLAVFYLGLIVHLVLGYGGVLRVFGLGLGKFINGVKEASITAFVTRSSNATLPVTMRVSEENLGVPQSISAFALPIGATVNMDGTAIYLTIGAVFIGNAVGMPLGLEQQLMLMLVATLGAIGAAGVPGAGAIMMLMVLEAVNLPVTAGSAVAVAYALILGIDALFDMGRTCMNVTGDVVGVAVVAKTENTLDMSKW
jgi:Na+/H+-dicarboxylate symporter